MNEYEIERAAEKFMKRSIIFNLSTFFVEPAPPFMKTKIDAN